jgi:hypothetical protein
MNNWVYFTLEGTLIDERLAEEKAALFLLKDVLGLNLARRKHWAAIWSYTYQHFANTFCSERESKEQIWLSMFQEFKPSLNKQECDALIPLFKSEYLRNLRAFSDVPEVLFRLIDCFQLGLILPSKTTTRGDGDIPAGIGSLFNKIIYLPFKMSEEESASAQQLLLASHFEDTRLGKISLISSDYDFLLGYEEMQHVLPIWLNRTTSKQSPKFRTITSLHEIL